MTESNISDRGGLESRYTVGACDVIIKWHSELAEKYEAETERKRLLGLFLETFDDLGSEVIFYYNMQDGDNTILWSSNHCEDENAIIIYTDVPSGRFIIGMDNNGVPIALTAEELIAHTEWEPAPEEQ